MNDLSRKGREPQTAGLFRQENKILTSPSDGGPQSCPGRSHFPERQPAGRSLHCWFHFPTCLLFPTSKHWNTSMLFPSVPFCLPSISFSVLHICFLYFFFFLSQIINTFGSFPIISFLLYSPFFFYWVYTLFFLFPLLVDSSFFSFFKYLWLEWPSWFAQDWGPEGFLRMWDF